MTTESTIQPALTPGQWEEAQQWAASTYGWGGSDDLVSLSHWNDHAAAALHLHGQPFGFTHEDVRRVQFAARRFLAMPIADAEALERLADRIAALLPPAP